MDRREQNLTGPNDALAFESVAKHRCNRAGFGVGLGENGDLFAGTALSGLLPGIGQRIDRRLQPVMKLNEAMLIERLQGSPGITARKRLRRLARPSFALPVNLAECGSTDSFSHEPNSVAWTYRLYLPLVADHHQNAAAVLPADVIENPRKLWA